jgi:hypothetical protein
VRIEKQLAERAVGTELNFIRTFFPDSHFFGSVVNYFDIIMNIIISIVIINIVIIVIIAYLLLLHKVRCFVLYVLLRFHPTRANIIIDL